MGFGFCSVLYGVKFGSIRVLAHYLLSGSVSVRFLAKPRSWFGSFLLGPGFSDLYLSYHQTERAFSHQNKTCIQLKDVNLQKYKREHANNNGRIVVLLPLKNFVQWKHKLTVAFEIFLQLAQLLNREIFTHYCED